MQSVATVSSSPIAAIISQRHERLLRPTYSPSRRSSAKAIKNFMSPLRQAPVSKRGLFPLSTWVRTDQLARFTEICTHRSRLVFTCRRD